MRVRGEPVPADHGGGQRDQHGEEDAGAERVAGDEVGHHRDRRAGEHGRWVPAADDQQGRPGQQQGDAHGVERSRVGLEEVPRGDRSGEGAGAHDEWEHHRREWARPPRGTRHRSHQATVGEAGVVVMPQG